MMKKFLLLTVLALALIGCKNFEDLKAGNELALENQSNLEPNTMRSFENYKKMLTLYADALKKHAEIVTDEEEKKKLLEEASKAEAKVKTAEEQQNVTVEQLAIGRAWLLVLQEAIKKDTLNADLLGSVIEDLPGWIKAGKDIYDLIKSKMKK
jgi:hypothetical protein